MAPDSTSRYSQLLFTIRHSLVPFPHLLRQFDDHPQLRPLLLLGEHVALLGRGEAALRREAELFDIDEFRSLVDAPAKLVAAFERAGLAGDETEHHGLARGHEPQRL